MYYLKKRRSKDPIPNVCGQSKHSEVEEIIHCFVAPDRKLEQMRRQSQLLNVKNCLMIMNVQQWNM